MEVGLAQATLLDGGPNSSKGAQQPPPNLGYLLWPNSWMDQDTTLYGGRPRPSPHCVRWGPSSPRPEGAQEPPTFRPLPIVAKQSPISATGEHLFYKIAAFY